MGFEKGLGAVKVIKDQIQYRSQSLLNLARDYFSFIEIVFKLWTCAGRQSTISLCYASSWLLNWTKRQIEANSDCPEHNGMDINRPVCVQVGCLSKVAKMVCRGSLHTQGKHKLRKRLKRMPLFSYESFYSSLTTDFSSAISQVETIKLYKLVNTAEKLKYSHKKSHSIGAINFTTQDFNRLTETVLFWYTN